MNPKITWKYILAFIALNMLLGELHEQAHIQTGFILSGCYGNRDFNVWETCEKLLHSPLQFLPTLAGPLFSYLVYWVCALFLLRSSNTQKVNLGVAVLFAMLPFARIFTACMGAGDEKTVLVYLLQGQLSIGLLKIIAAIWVILFCLPPLLAAVKCLPEKNRWWYIIGFNIGPLLFGILWQRMFLNKLLVSKLWQNKSVAGTPVLIMIHFFIMLLLLTIFGKTLMGEAKSYPLRQVPPVQ